MSENIESQYRIIAGHAGWVDRGGRGAIRVDGPDRLTFLHALVTNEVMSLPERAGVRAAYLTPQGRMIADLEVLNRGESVMVFTAASMTAALVARLDALIFAEQVSLADVSAEWAEVAVTGSAAAAVVSEAVGADERAVDALVELQQTDLAEGFVFRGGDSAMPIFSIVVPAGDRARTIARLESLGAVAVAPELATALRIEAGRPAWGADLFEDTIPLEAGLLERAISTTKGCYVGQEVIIRILHRGGGRVAKRLVQLAFATGSRDVPAPGTVLLHGAEVVGRVTSAAFSPARDAVVALGYVQRDSAEIGKTIGIGSGGVSAEITGLAG